METLSLLADGFAVAFQLQNLLMVMLGATLGGCGSASTDAPSVDPSPPPSDTLPPEAAALASTPLGLARPPLADDPPRARHARSPRRRRVWSWR